MKLHISSLTQKIVALTTLLMLAIACSPSLMMPTAQDEALAKQQGNDITLDKLHTGYNLYTRKCGGCHLLFKPSEFTAKKWETTFPEMSKRSLLSKEEDELVLQYLLVKCKKG